MNFIEALKAVADCKEVRRGGSTLRLVVNSSGRPMLVPSSGSSAAPSSATPVAPIYGEIIATDWEIVQPPMTFGEAMRHAAAGKVVRRRSAQHQVYRLGVADTSVIYYYDVKQRHPEGGIRPHLTEELVNATDWEIVSD